VQVAIYVEPPAADDSASSSAAVTRANYAYDRFADELGAALGATVAVRELPLAAAQAGELVLLHSYRGLAYSISAVPAGQRAGAQRQIVLLAADRTSVWEELAAYQLAGAIVDRRLFLWRHDLRTGGGSYGLHGLRAVADQLGAEITQTVGHYALFGSNRYHGMSALLAAYLQVYGLSLPPS
jgi:hypothetical protein